MDVQTRGELAIIDPRSNRIIRRLPLRGCANPHGLLVDSARRLAFIACDANARLLTLDLRDLRIVGNDGVGDTPDVLAFPTVTFLVVAVPAAETGADQLLLHFVKCIRKRAPWGAPAGRRPL